MFLRNYDNLMLVANGLLMGTSMTVDSNNKGKLSQYHGSYNGDYTSTTLYGEGHINARNCKGELRAISNAVSNGGSNTDRGSISIFKLNKEMICLGTGDTPVDYEDYKLSGTIIPSSNLQFASANATYNEESHKWIKTAIYVYDNTAGVSDVTIREWGIWYYNYSASSPAENASFGSNTTYDTLLYREIFDEPIVVPAGESATIKFTVELPMVNHP